MRRGGNVQVLSRGLVIADSSPDDGPQPAAPVQWSATSLGRCCRHLLHFTAHLLHLFRVVVHGRRFRWQICGLFRIGSDDRMDD